MHRYDIYDCYRASLFNVVTQYANKNSQISEVADLLSVIQNYKNQYEDEINNLLNPEFQTIENEYALWESTDKKKQLCKKIAIVCIIVVIVVEIISSIVHSHPLTPLMSFISFFVVPIAFITFIVFKVQCKLQEKTYSQHFYAISSSATEITNQYYDIADKLYSKIDNLYLNSLDPTHREMVLARRDQERQHRELMKQQAQYQKDLKEQQDKLYKAQLEVLDLQRKKEQRELDELERRKNRSYY